MSFEKIDLNKIGKLYTKDNNFYMCCGYNFLENQYILASLETIFNHRSYILLTNNFKETTILEIEKNIDDKIDEYKDIIILINLFSQKIKEEKRKNYQIELSNLPNKCFELQNSINYMKKELDNQKLKHNEDTIKEYEKMLKSSLKGMKRLEKRFYFFFNKDGIDIVTKLKNITPIKYYSAKSKYKNLLKEKETIKINYEELLNTSQLNLIH